MIDWMTAPAPASPPLPAPAEEPPVLPRIARLLAPYKGKLLLVALAVLVAAGLTSLTPFLTRAVFDNALFVAAARICSC